MTRYYIDFQFELDERDKIIFEKFLAENELWIEEGIVEVFNKGLKAVKSEFNSGSHTTSSTAEVTELNSRLKDAWNVIKCLVEKSEKQEEQLAILDKKIYDLCAVNIDGLKMLKQVNDELQHQVIQQNNAESEETNCGSEIDKIAICRKIADAMSSA